MQEAVTNMRKAKSVYSQRLEEYQKSPLGIANQTRAASSTSASEADSDFKNDHRKKFKEDDLHQKVNMLPHFCIHSLKKEHKTIKLI